MADPSAVTDANGEWFEVFNSTGGTIDLNGLTFRDAGAESFTVSSSVLIPAGGRAVLGRNGVSATNGGLRVDYVYGTAMNLSNTSDVIEILSGTTSIDRVAYDSVGFSLGVGRATSLSMVMHDASSNDVGTSWCRASATFGAGDFGTPSMENPTCGGMMMGRTYDFSRTPGLSIPDDIATGVSDSLVASTTGCTTASVTVDVDITHTYIGDLIIVLRSPSGTMVTLHNVTGSSADNIVGTYPTTLVVDGPGTLADFAGASPNGTWRLTVSDNAGADLGTLDSWGLHITCR
jgi:subtilisin-like proprotein convertase family protein